MCFFVQVFRSAMVRNSINMDFFSVLLFFGVYAAQNAHVYNVQKRSLQDRGLVAILFYSLSITHYVIVRMVTIPVQK